jgi:hypothetical protein
MIGVPLLFFRWVIWKDKKEGDSRIVPQDFRTLETILVDKESFFWFGERGYYEEDSEVLRITGKWITKRYPGEESIFMARGYLEDLSLSKEIGERGEGRKMSIKLRGGERWSLPEIFSADLLDVRGICVQEIIDARWRCPFQILFVRSRTDGEEYELLEARPLGYYEGDAAFLGAG